MSEPQLLKVECASCKGHIEFPKELHGEIVTCPHCGLSTVLRVAGVVESSPPPIRTQHPAAARTPEPQTIYIKEKAKTGCLTQIIGVGLFILLAVFIISMLESPPTPSGSPSGASSTHKTVNANIRCSSTTISILNKDMEPWADITVYLNGKPPFTYSARLGAFKPNERREFPLREFVKDSGERFNPATTKVVEVWIGGGDYDYMSYGF